MFGKIMMKHPKKVIAAIDIGSNSAHMVIAEIDHVGEMRVLDTYKVTLRLGQAILADGNFSEEVIRRTGEALLHMKEIIKPFNAVTRAVATYATREAKNQKRFLREIERVSGIKVEVVDGIEEARLVFLGMRYGLALDQASCVGMDIGGGSTELIFAKDDDIAFATSLRLGAVTLTEKYFSRGYSQDGLKKMTDHVISRLAPLREETATLPFDRAVASSGTAKAIAIIHAKLQQGIDIKDVNGYVLTRNDVLATVAEIQKLATPGKIKDATGIEQSRAEIIVAGATIFQEVTNLLKIKEWSVTSYGLREGLVADTFYRLAGGRATDLPDIQWHSVVQYGKRLGINSKHGEQVRKLAVRLLEQLSPICAAETSTHDDAKLLQAAAYLREAGKFVSTPRYHHHSQYLISNTRLYGFTEYERVFTGLLARFQRKALPSADHPELADMPASEFRRLRFLAGILRLAAILDRTRQGLIKDVLIRHHGKDLTILLIPENKLANPEVEIHKARLEIDALEKSWDLKLSFEVSR